MASILEEFHYLPVQNFAAGETVIEEGTLTGRLYILIEGRMELTKAGKPVIERRQPGDILGEISALLHIPHTVTVRAACEARLHVVADARLFLEQNPTLSVRLAELLARRLASLTDYLLVIKDQYAGHDHLGMLDEILEAHIHRHPRARIPSRLSSTDIA